MALVQFGNGVLMRRAEVTTERIEEVFLYLLSGPGQSLLNTSTYPVQDIFENVVKMRASHETVVPVLSGL